jgi:hypothetical protein
VDLSIPILSKFSNEGLLKPAQHLHLVFLFLVKFCTLATNKMQGQTMKIVGICLPEPVFTHGQLYVALSRATHVNDISVFYMNGRMTTNVVYMELLR